MKVSVCICTHNGGRRLAAVLDCLARQTAPAESWEVIVVDNASTDDTAAAAAAGLARHAGMRGRVVAEPEAGLSFARRRGALEASGEIVCFLDDDNLADPDFIETACRIFAEHPKTGSAGGKVLADWETEPTPLVRAVEGYALAIVDRGDAPFVYEWVADGPVGAGMCIRRDLVLAALHDLDMCGSVTDRRGSSLVSGGDMALAVKVCQAGYERRYDPALRVRHRLPAERMTRDYLLRLHEGIGRGQAAVRRLWARRGDRRAMALFVAFKDGLLWLRGLVLGPGAGTRLTAFSLPAGAAPASLRGDLHAMEQSLLRGRVAGALEFAFSRRPRK